MTTTANQLTKSYDPSGVEKRLYEWWENRGYFQPDSDPGKPVFVITIPPPNVTGELHLGHVMTYCLEDVIGRYKRMRGFATLILPGSDHASIAVHSKVEAMLAEEGIRRRFDIDRDAFVTRAWEWKEKYGAAIEHQFRALGQAFDWSRNRFTMDDRYYRAVMTMFVRLYEEGFIYRGSRVINWCPGCRTGISDIEIDDVEREDKLYYVRMPFAEGAGDIVVATVRPETMFGDVAIAVHPEDERYISAVGFNVKHPLTGHLIPIIADDFVDPAFGSGAVKITPAHDYADFEVGENHDLPMPVVITEHATMADDVQAPYAGMPILEARDAAVKQLQDGGYMVEIKPLVHNVPTCERSGDVIEPLLSEQWFMRMTELAQPAIDVVRTGRVKFVPERWTRIYLDWMENIRPWNISRQLWWGQRIPIYHCENGHITCSVDAPTACRECDSTAFIQDPDVLDTWFSSALWPFATLGWPDETADLKRFYPTSFMNTSSQILYLWIARMIMMGLHFMDDIPYPVVVINPTILNEKGQRMSKSLGTGIDPIETIDLYGADATRYGMFTSGSTIQQEIRYAGHERSQDGQRFANKVWNVARYVLQNLEESEPTSTAIDGRVESLPDRWILSRLSAVTDEVTHNMESYDLSAGLRAIHDFFWSGFADWYVEMAKIELRSNDPAVPAGAQATLWTVLAGSMRLLHPYMPFITEEIWSSLKCKVPFGALDLAGLSEPLPESIMVADWPQPAIRDDEGEANMDIVMSVIRAVRNLRAEHNVKPRAQIPASIIAADQETLIALQAPIIAGMANLEPMGIIATASDHFGDVAQATAGSIRIHIPLAALTDIDEEIGRLEKELEKARKEYTRLNGVLSNPNFVERAAQAVVEAERAKEVAAAATITQIEEHLKTLRNRP